MPRFHECELCDASFNRGHDLRRHERTHSKDRPFKCPLCDHTTIQKSNMKNHMNKHTGAKPFKCDQCDKGFTEPGSRTKHKKSAHGYKPRDRKSRIKVPVAFKKPYACAQLKEPTPTPDFIPPNVAQAAYSASHSYSYDDTMTHAAGTALYFKFEPSAPQDTRSTYVELAEHEYPPQRFIYDPNYDSQVYYAPESQQYTQPPTYSDSSDATLSPVEEPQSSFFGILALCDMASQADRHNSINLSFHHEAVDDSSFEAGLDALQQAAQEYYATLPPLAPLPASPVEMSFDESLIDPALRDL